MSTAEPDITVPVTLPAHYARRLSVLTDPDAGMPDLEAVIFELIDHAQQGVYRPGAWEREWVCQAFGNEWTRRMEPDTRPEMLSADGRVIFERPATLEDEDHD